MKLWGGRFSKEVDEQVNDFNSSIAFDARLWQEDIQGSMAHAAMLGRQGIIEPAEAQAIREGLSRIREDVAAGTVEFTPDNEDIHMNIEALLTGRIGAAGKRLHTARSRNDQVAVDLRLYLKKEIGTIRDLVLDLMQVLTTLAGDNLTTWMPGYTHLQRAQPITFGHHLLAYCEMLLRDLSRLDDALARMNVCPLGSGALAGTTYPLDRDRTAALLGFDHPTHNSLDSVAQRDYMADYHHFASLFAVHVSRMAEDLIIWSTQEYGWLKLPDAFCTGSSMMPQKKNPDVLELSRGKAGQVLGHMMNLRVTLKGLPMTYDRDLQEDKRGLWASLDTVE